MVWIRGVIGIIALLIGALWILQGLNVIGQSAMSGHAGYAVLGLAVAAVGVWLLFGPASRFQAVMRARRQGDSQ